MTIESDVWPDNRTPGKEEIERMYKCAYYIDRTFLRPADVVEFGIDFVRLKEFGEVVMRKPINQLRQKAPGLWERMNKSQKTMFLYSYFTQGIKYLNKLVDNLEPLIGNCMSERHGLTSLLNTLNRKFPADLRDKIEDGFGKEWSL